MTPAVGASTGAGDTPISSRRRPTSRRPPRDIRERLGFGGEAEQPVALEAIELPAPRLGPPAALAEIVSRRPPRARHARARQGLPRRRPRLSRARSTTRPTSSPARATRREVEAVLGWCADARRRGDPLRRRHQRRRRGRAADSTATTPARSARPRRRSTACSRSTRSRAPRGSRPASSARRSTSSSPSTASPCATSRSRSSTRPSAAGSRPAPAATSPPSGRTSTIWSSRSACSRRPASGRAAGCPGSGAGPSPDRMLIGSEGILGVITEAWVRVHERPQHKALGRRSRSTSFAAGAEAVRALAQSGLNPSNCRLLDETEAEITHADDRGRAVLVLGFESAHQPVDALFDQALELARDHGGEVERSERRTATAQRAAEATPSAPGATPSSPRRTCATPSSPSASSPTPSRPRSPGTASRSSTPP